MSDLKPHVALLLAANGFLTAPNAFRERLIAAVAAFDAADIPEKQEPLWRQFRDACERAAEAPAANLPVVKAGLGEILKLVNDASRAAAEPPVPAARDPSSDWRHQPIVCPHCNELSRSRALCDVCGEEIEASVGDAA